MNILLLYDIQFFLIIFLFLSQEIVQQKLFNIIGIEFFTYINFKYVNVHCNRLSYKIFYLSMLPSIGLVLSDNKLLYIIIIYYLVSKILIYHSLI